MKIYLNYLLDLRLFLKSSTGVQQASESKTRFFRMISMNIKALASVAVLSLGASMVRAEVVYDLSGGPGNNYYQGFKEFGDELHLAAGGVIQSFSFDYFANYSQSAGVTFKIYANDGGLVSGSSTPGTLLDSRTLDVASGGGHVVINYPFDAANVLLTQHADVKYWL